MYTSLFSPFCAEDGWFSWDVYLALFSFLRRRWMVFMRCIPRSFLLFAPKMDPSIFGAKRRKERGIHLMKNDTIHKIWSGWAWKFINMVSPIHTFNYQTFTRLHVRLMRHLFFPWKLHFISSAAEKQHATKFIDPKRKFMELMIGKLLHFC